MDKPVPRLSHDEDDELRRMNLFRSFGAMAGKTAARFDELRSRDRRAEVREPKNDGLIGTLR